MQLNMLRSLLKTGITEFGGLTYPITTERLPQVCDTTITNIKRQCPTNLVRMTVIETNHKWVEKFTFGCGGDQEHERERKNGVLVEFEWNASFVKNGESLRDAVKRIDSLDLYSVVYDDEEEKGPTGVQLVVSHKVLIVPWGEYALVLAEREKKEAEQEARREEMRAIAAKLGVISGEKQKTKGKGGTGTWDFYEDFLYDRATPNPDDYKDDKDRKQAIAEQRTREQRFASADYAFADARYHGASGTTLLYGRVILAKEHAEKIGAVLEAVRVGDLDAARVAVEKI